MFLLPVHENISMDKTCGHLKNTLYNRQRIEWHQDSGFHPGCGSGCEHTSHDFTVGNGQAHH